MIVFVIGMVFTPVPKQTNSEALEQHLKEEQNKLDKEKNTKKKTSSTSTALDKEKVTKNVQNVDDQQSSATAVAAKKETTGKDIKPMTVSSSISVTAIGDSVMLSAASSLKKQIPQIVVDAKVGRQVYETTKIVNNLKQKGQLGKVVVLGLGSNGDFSETQLNNLLETIGDDHHIYLVNTRVPRNWQNNVNRKIKYAVKKHKNVKLIDWYSVTNRQYDLFYDDQIHPNQTGAEYYTALISSKIATGER